MPPDRNLRTVMRWTFRLVNSPFADSAWWFAWEVFDEVGNKINQSALSFETLTEAIEDAKQHGYVEPEQR
jgi:hypothetical protein